MRNLKRVLSLTLASVMLLGMMVVGSSAAKGYPDVSEEDNVEAIEVIQAIEVMIGDENGNFRPDSYVSRAEMAVVMAKLLNLDYDYYVTSCPFTDVSGVYDWARGSVGACFANKILSGRSETEFDPGATVTAVEASSMLMRALGYFQYANDVADGFELATVRQGTNIGIYEGVGSSATEPMTRNQVAQIVLNALKSGMVQPDGNTINLVTPDGSVLTGKVNYVYVTSTKSFASAISSVRATSMGSANDSTIVELGEQLYDGKLKLDADSLDVFGRPSRKWEFDGKAIGTYAKEELMVMDNVGGVTGNDLYTLLGASTIKDYDVLVTIDGVDNQRSDAKTILGNAWFDDADMNRSNKEKVGATGTGVLTQVFVDHEKDEIYVAIINTYLARASRDYDDKSEEATLTVYGINELVANKEYVKTAGEHETMKVQDEDFALVQSVKKDDSYLVTVADQEIQTMVLAEVMEAVTLSAFKKGDYVVSGGTNYNYTTTATYKDGDLDNYTGINGAINLKDMTYNIYLDAYDNLIGIEEVDAVKNYVFLAGIDVDGSNLYSKTATANALFLDGTSKTIKIDLSKSSFPAHPGLDYTHVTISGNALLNTWCTYTVSNDMYTVKEVYATKANPLSGTTASVDNYPQPDNSDAPNNTKLAQTWQATTATGKVSVKNLRLEGGANSGVFTNIYGDSTSVYLTAELDELFNDSDKLNVGYSYGIIKGVDSVTTGVADTSIEVWTYGEAQAEADGSVNQPIGDTAYGIYTLYDSDGIVIASVVIGENDGVKDLVYVHSSGLDLESYSDNTWTWTRKVIFNGEEITLTEKGDAVSDLAAMEQYQWYEIKRNNDGEIVSADPAWHALGSYRIVLGEDRVDSGYFVDLFSDINDRMESADKDTILYQTNGGPYNYSNDPAVHSHAGLKDNLRVIGSNTLAFETDTGSGIHFRDNVNVVLQYYNQNTKQVEIETGTGVDRLKSMVEFVNANNEVRGTDYYYLSALIEKNFATTIVIYDSYNNYQRPSTALGTYELTLGGVLNSTYTTPASSNSDVYIVNDDGSITYVESNDDLAKSSVNGFKRYTIPYGATVRIYDNDTANSFLPFFSPIKPIYSFYDYYARPTAQRAYIEFTVSSRLDSDKLTIRERMVTDGIYVGVEADAKATITVTQANGTSKTYKAGESVIVYDGQRITANTTEADAKLYVNGELHAAPYSWIVDVDKDIEFIVSTAGGTEGPVDPAKKYYTVTFNEGNFTTDAEAQYEENSAVEITITADEGYEIVSVDGEAAPEGATSAKYTLDAITENVTVEVVTKESEGENPNPVTTVEAVYSSTGDTTVTLPEGVEAGKTLTVEVSGMPSGVWFKIVGGYLAENDGAARNVDGTMAFRYTPTAAEVAAGSVDFEFTGFNATEFNSSVVKTLGIVDGGLGIVEIPNLTVSNVRARSITPDHVGSLERGDYAEMILGGEDGYAVPGSVNANGNIVFPMSNAQALIVIARFNALTPDETGCVDVAVETSAVTTDGEANVDGKKINFDLGTPKATGVKLPTTVTVDGKVTAKVNWFYNGTAIDPDSEDIYANESDLSKYTYQVVEPAIVAGSGLEFPVTIVAPGRVEWEVEIADAESLEKVAVKPGDIDTDNDITAPEDTSGLDPVFLNEQNKWVANYDGNGDKLSEARIKFEVGQLMGGTVGEINPTTGAAVVTKPDGSKVNITFSMVGGAIEQVKNWKVFYKDELLDWAVDNTNTNVGNFAAGTVLLKFVKADLGKTFGTAETIAEGQVAITTDKDVYLYNAIQVAAASSELTGAKVVTSTGGVNSTANFSGDAVLPGTTLLLTGAVGTANTYTQLAYTNKDGDKVAFESNLVENTDAQKYTLVVNSDKAVDGVVTLTETTGLYRVVIEGMTGEWFGKNDADLTVTGVPAGNYAVEYKTLPADIMTPDFGSMTIDKDLLVSTSDALGDTVNNPAKGDGTIEVKKAYKVDLDTTFVGAVGYVAQKGDDPVLSETFATGNYLIPGIKVFVEVDQGTKISSSDSTMPLTLATDVTVAGKDVYSFTMPAKDVAKTVINKGTSVEFNTNGNSDVVESDGIIQTDSPSADCDIEITITSASSTKPVITWSPFPSGDMDDATTKYQIPGVTTSAVVADEENTTDDVYVWTVTLTVDGATLSLGNTKYMVVTIGSEKIVLPVKTKDPISASIAIDGTALSSVASAQFDFGATLPTLSVTAATGIVETSTDLDGVWTYSAIESGTYDAATGVNAPGFYKVTFALSAEAGYALDAASNDPTFTYNGETLTATRGTADGKTTLTYTFEVEGGLTPTITPNGTGITSEGVVASYSALSGEKLTAEKPATGVDGAATINFVWYMADDLDNSISATAALNLAASGSAANTLVLDTVKKYNVTVKLFLGDPEDGGVEIGSADFTIDVQG